MNIQNPPNLHIIQLELTAEYATGAAETCELALLNVRYFLKYVAPFVPPHLYAEYMRTVSDVEFALQVAEAA